MAPFQGSKRHTCKELYQWRGKQQIETGNAATETISILVGFPGRAPSPERPVEPGWLRKDVPGISWPLLHFQGLDWLVAHSAARGLT